MSCTNFDMVSALVDNELGAEEAAEAQRHLFACEACREAYRNMRALRAELAVEPQPEALPLRLDLSLTAMAQSWLDGEQLQEPGSGKPSWASYHEHGQARHWRHFAAAAAAAMLVLVGMGLFAPKGSSVLTLSAIEPNVYGLSRFGQSALSTHVDHASTSRHIPAASTISLERDLYARLGFPVSLPKSHFGAPLDARVIEIEGEPVAMVDYRFNETPITLFALPREVAIEKLDIEFEAEAPNVCTAQDIHTCYGDDAGTSLCVLGHHDQALVWVSHMPTPSLDKLTRPLP